MTLKQQSRKASISILKSRNQVVRICKKLNTKTKRTRCRKIGLSLVDSKTRLEKLTRII